MRSFIAYPLLVLLIRLMGKTHVAELSVIEFVVAITIGSIASTATVELENGALPSSLGVVAWAVLALVTSQTELYNRGFNRLVNERPRVLIDGGRINKDALRWERLTMEDLLMQLRKKGAFDLKEVEVAVIERDGTLSVLKRSQNQPVTPQDMGIPTQYKGLPTVLILDGHIQDENLEEIGQSKEWLRETVRAQGADSIEDVIYCAIDTTGTVYVDAATGGRGQTR